MIQKICGMGKVYIPCLIRLKPFGLITSSALGDVLMFEMTQFSPLVCYFTSSEFKSCLTHDVLELTQSVFVSRK